jgi:septal ring factor EnvC (AmiA/AmiB activator)
LKILFAADSATEMVQQYQYLSRVLKHDKELLERHRKAMQAHQRQLDELSLLKQKKEALLAEVQHQRQVAARGRQLQARLLKKARHDKKKLAGELTQLKENARRLKKLITRLKQQPVSAGGPVAGNFAVGRGKLGWPVNGRVVIGFGQQRDKALGTFYESNGLEIAVPPGSPIRAVASGKIVFADYFKGYGNLFIISHPGGYHTLYAQVDQMIKKLGDHVSAGDLLGKSGLGGRDSMYFEIRSNGSPVNPLSWLKHR